MKLRSYVIALTLVCAACAKSPAPQPEANQAGPAAFLRQPAAAVSRDPAAQRTIPIVSEPAQPKVKSPRVTQAVKAQDPPAVIHPQVNLSVYQLSVPLGTVSRSAAFWKHVQEDAVDVATHDLLQKNGLRVGLARLSEFDDIMGALGKVEIEPRPLTFITAGVKAVELPMKRAVPSQLIYDFDARNTLTVKSYEECDNILVLEFKPSARKAGDVKVRLCPMVRDLRKRPVALGDDEMRDVEFVNVEKYFDLNLRTDLPMDHVLIVGLSEEGSARMSLGHSFLVQEGNTEKYEQVLLMVPQIMQPRARRPAESASNDEPRFLEPRQ